jgi:hypothetical protein
MTDAKRPWRGRPLIFWTERLTPLIRQPQIICDNFLNWSGYLIMVQSICNKITFNPNSWFVIVKIYVK